MAVAPLGKCIVLSLLLLLFYVGYGFRIRDGPLGSIEQQQQQQQQQHGACAAGKCSGEVGGGQVTLGVLKKRIETKRIGSLRQPPVADEKDEDVTEHVRSRWRPGRWGFKDSVREETQESEDDDDDIIVEDEEVGSDETEEINMDDDEDEDDEELKEPVKEAIKETSKKEVKWRFRGTTNVAEDDDDDDEEEEQKEAEKNDTQSSAINKFNDEEERNGDDDESEETGEKDESPKGEDNTEEVDSMEKEKKKEEKPVVDRKLEKVRFADKGKSKLEVTPSADKKAAIFKEKSQDETKKVKSQNDQVKEKDKSTVEESKLKVEEKSESESTQPKETTKDKQSTEEKVSIKDEKSVKKQDEKKNKEKEKPKPKTMETSKVNEKTNKVKEKTDKVGLKEDKVKEKPNQEKPKSKTESKKAKAEVKLKKESEQSDKTRAEQTRKPQGGSISLADLNDAILHIPNFVPNFTAIEDPTCQQHGKIFLRQLRGRKLWALQMLDSSAKIPSGLLRGNVNQLGDFDQCLGVSSKVRLDDKQTLKIQGKYCLASIDIQATLPDAKVPVNLMQSRGFLRANMRDSGHFVPKFTTINWALCIPAACSAADARSAIETGLSHFNTTSGIKFIVDVNPDMCYVQQKSLSYSKETIGVLYFFAMIICIVLVATVRDYIIVSDKASYSERIIMSFSLRRTLKLLTKPAMQNSADISCIHGIRSLATMALYVGHRLIPLAGVPYTNRVVLTEVANNAMSSLLRVSLVYTDAFLLLSGVLSAFNMTHESNTRGEIRWFCRFIGRIIRLTPLLLVVVFWYAFIMEHTGSGPQWNNIIKANSDLCKQNLWTNLLYIQNFFPFEEMCATHTHQLALDMQLSLLAPVLVFFLQVKPIIGVLLIFFFLQVSATLRYFATVNNYLSLVVFHGMTAKHLYKTANLTYTVPLHRATPYLFGVGLGVLLNYTGKKIKIYKIFVILGWIIAAFLGCWSLFSPWKMARRDYIYDVEEAAHYAVIGPVSWALALCWLIFACFTGHGGFINKFLSSHLLILFSRISYSVYLVQFAVFFYNLATTRYSSELQIHKVVDLYEASTVIVLSVILTLFLDIPTQEVKKVLMESTDAAQSESTEQKPSRDQSKKSKPGSRKPSRTPEPEAYNMKLHNDLELDYSEEEDPRWRSRKPNGKQRIFIRRNSKEDDYRAWGLKRDEDRRRSSSTQRALHVDPEGTVRSSTPGRHSEDLRRERRSASRALEASSKLAYEDRRRDRSNSRPSDRAYYRELEAPPRASIKSESRGKSPRLRRTPVRLTSSGSEEEPFKLRAKSPRRPVERPRISDEDAWEQELRIRRQKFREQGGFDGQAGKLEREESTDLSRRSSAEGKIALLQGPTGSKVMEAWTVSKGPGVSLGSSQEPTDTEEESRYVRDFGEEPLSERRQSLDSLSHEEIDFAFKITDSKTKTMMDLRQISSGEDDQREILGEMTPVATGKLFKRESIIKSQASEEDPEYLLPERPKLMEQEQEHPFRKAWQMQKSKSEEDRPSAFAIKERRASGEFQKDSKNGNDNDKKTPSPPSADPTFRLIVEDVDSGNWQTQSQESRSSVTESSEDLENEEEEEDVESSRQSRNDVDDISRISSRSNGTESVQFDWPNEEEQFDRYRRQRRNFEDWEQEGDET